MGFKRLHDIHVKYIGRYLETYARLPCLKTERSYPHSIRTEKHPSDNDCERVKHRDSLEISQVFVITLEFTFSGPAYEDTFILSISLRIPSGEIEMGSVIRHPRVLGGGTDHESAGHGAHDLCGAHLFSHGPTGGRGKDTRDDRGSVFLQIDRGSRTGKLRGSGPVG